MRENKLDREAFGEEQGRYPGAQQTAIHHISVNILTMAAVNVTHRSPANKAIYQEGADKS